MRRNPVVVNGGYTPSRDDYTVLSVLDRIREDSLSNPDGYSSLLHSIYDLSPEDVNRIIESRSSDGIAMRMGSLRGYQTYGVCYMLTAGNLLLTDSVGLGKTSQASAVINLKRSRLRELHPDRKFRYLFFTEVGLVEQAQSELIRFTGRYIPTTTGASDSVDELIEWVDGNVDSFDGLVASYSAVSSSYKFMVWMSNFVKKYGRFDVVFVDEGSVLANRMSGVAGAFKSLRDKFVRNRIVLNATPFERDLLTFYTQLDFIEPTAVPMRGVFDDLFISKNHTTGVIYGYKNPEMFKSMFRYLTFGQTRMDLGVEVKGSSCEVVMYRLSEKQRELLNLTIHKSYVFDDPSWLDPSIEVTESINPKLLALRYLMESKIGSDKVMVYTKNIESQETLSRYLESHGYRSLILNGNDNTPKKKAKKVEMFRNEDYQVLITNLKKGLNLDFTKHLVFYSYSEMSSLTVQIEGRIIRSQSIHDKHVYMLVGNSHEYKSLAKSKKSTEDRLSHTSNDISLVCDFLLKEGNLNYSINKCKELLKGDSSSDIALCGLYYADGLENSSRYYNSWSSSGEGLV